MMQPLRRFNFVSALILALCFSIAAIPLPAAFAATPNYDSYHGFVTSENPVLPDDEVHPKLWFSQDDIAELYAKRNADDYANRLWNSIISSPYLTMPLPAESRAACTDSSLHSYYGDMARIAKYNAFMYIMEGDSVHKDRAVSAILRAFDGPIYSCDPTDSSSPVDETYRAVWVQNFAAAYDWIQSELTAEQDAQIRERLAKEAKLTYEQIHIWGPRPHNHRSKPAWGLGTIALVLSDHPDASKWLQKALEMVNTNTKYFFSSDGIYREGSQYYIYSHINFLPFLYHYKNVSGVDLFRVYKPAFLWEFYVSNNKGWMPNFADSYIRHNHLHMVASEFMSEEDVTPLHPTAKWGNLFQWRYMTTDTTPWGGEFGNNTGASNDDTMDLDKYLTYDPSIEPIAPEGTGTVFLNEGGQTIFRNHWNVNDPSARYLLFQGVADMDNHNHFDQLSFILHAENQLMASDAGYSRSSYGDAIRRSWYRTAPAHNTLTLNGSWPVDMAENVTPASKFSMDTDFFDFQQKEARYIDITNDLNDAENDLLFPPDSESLGYINRAIAFPNQEYFVVADQAWTKDGSAQPFDLYLHGGRGFMNGEGNFRQWIYANDPYGSSAKLSSWIFSNGAEFTDLKGEVSYVKDDYVEGDFVLATVHRAKANFLQILIPQQVTSALPIVTELSNEERVGGTVAMNGNLDTYLVQQTGNSVSLGRVVTDGDFVYVRDNGLVDQYAVRQATELTYAGEVWFRSSERMTLTMKVSDRSKHEGMIATDDPALTYSVSFKLPAGKMAASAQFDGHNVPVTNVGGFAVIESLTGTGKLAITFADSGDADVTAPEGITDLRASSSEPDSVTLTWTAPGNDGMSGIAAFYDVRYSTEPITEENWDSARKTAGEPKPGASGILESMTVRGLESDTEYYFAVKAGDEARNLSPISNAASAKTDFIEDVTAPGLITDVRLGEAGETTVQLLWTAPGDDGYTGTAERYEIRYSTAPIVTAEQWEAAIAADGAPQPGTAGTEQTAIVSGLNAGRTYFFAIRAVDEAGNRSGISNPLYVAMKDDPTTVRLRFIEVTASSHDGNVPSNAIDGNLQTRWSALSEGNIGNRTPQWIQFDLGAVQKLSHLKAAYASGNVRKAYFDVEVSADGSQWTKVLQNVETSGMTLEFETYELNDVEAKFVRIVGFGNSSSGWNSITEVEIYGSEMEELPPVSVGPVMFMDDSGNPITKLTPHEFLRVHVPIRNNQGESREISAIITLTRPDQRVEKAVTVTSLMESWKTGSFNAGFLLPNKVEGYLVKVYVWDGLDGMFPLTEVFRFPEQ